MVPTFRTVSLLNCSASFDWPLVALPFHLFKLINLDGCVLPYVLRHRQLWQHPQAPMPPPVFGMTGEVLSPGQVLSPGHVLSPGQVLSPTTVTTAVPALPTPLPGAATTVVPPVSPLPPPAAPALPTAPALLTPQLAPPAVLHAVHFDNSTTLFNQMAPSAQTLPPAWTSHPTLSKVTIACLRRLLGILTLHPIPWLLLTP